MLIKGDIGRDADTKEIIMVHPPEKHSDLTFKEWITTLSTAKKVRTKYSTCTFSDSINIFRIFRALS